MLLWTQFQGDEIYWSKLCSEFHEVNSVFYVVLFVMLQLSDGGVRISSELGFS